MVHHGRGLKARGVWSSESHCAFGPLPGISDRSEFTSGYLLQLAIICLYMTCLSQAACLPHGAGPCDCTLCSRDSSKVSDYKLSHVLNKIDCCVRFQSASCFGSILPGPTASRVVERPRPTLISLIEIIAHRHVHSF